MASRRNRRPRVCVCETPTPVLVPVVIGEMLGNVADSSFGIVTLNEIEDFGSIADNGVIVTNAGFATTVLSIDYGSPNGFSITLLDPLVGGSLFVEFPSGFNAILTASGGTVLAGVYGSQIS